jgi:hypothetical protein
MLKRFAQQHNIQDYLPINTRKEFTHNFTHRKEFTYNLPINTRKEFQANIFGCVIKNAKIQTHLTWKCIRASKKKFLMQI